jgi:hypothetical protein
MLPPFERTNKKMEMPGRPTRAGAEGGLAALPLDTPRDTTDSGCDAGVSVTALSQRWLAPDRLWLAI